MRLIVIEKKLKIIDRIKISPGRIRYIVYNYAYNL